jgi:hypothetical protein
MFCVLFSVLYSINELVHKQACGLHLLGVNNVKGIMIISHKLH